MPFARLIVNPVAGAKRTAKKWPHIKSHLSSIGLRFEHDVTEARGHARELAKLAVSKGYEMIVSVGGDGTINEIVNGVYDAGDNTDVLLGIISTGTGSDYIRTIGLSPVYQEACQCLLNPKKLTVDVGVIEYMSNNQTVKRLFVNFAGLGFDVEIVKATTQKFKLLSATPAYLMGLLTTLISYQNKSVSLIADGDVLTEKICTILMSNGKFGGGGMCAAPDADLTDGLLDVLVVGDLSKPDLLWSLPKIYKGTHLTHPKVTSKRAREIELRSTEALSLQADGELLGELPARCYVLPSALSIAV
jgi:YegS/Rv2252/BmrU family lipid kinase